MQALQGFSILLLIQAAGEVLTHLLGLSLPGSVLGMMMLLVALAWPPLRAPIQAGAEYLLSHLSLLFVPISVGIITQIPLLKQYGDRIALVLLISTAIGLAVTAWVMRWLMPADTQPAPPDSDDDNSPTHPSAPANGVASDTHQHNNTRHTSDNPTNHASDNAPGHTRTSVLIANTTASTTSPVPSPPTPHPAHMPDSAISTHIAHIPLRTSALMPHTAAAAGEFASAALSPHQAHQAGYHHLPFNAVSAQYRCIESENHPIPYSISPHTTTGSSHVQHTSPTTYG